MEKLTDGQRLDYDSEESKYIPTFTIIYIYIYFQSRNMNKKSKPFRPIIREPIQAFPETILISDGK